MALTLFFVRLKNNAGLSTELKDAYVLRTTYLPTDACLLIFTPFCPLLHLYLENN